MISVLWILKIWHNCLETSDSYDLPFAFFLPRGFGLRRLAPRLSSDVSSSDEVSSDDSDETAEVSDDIASEDMVSSDDISSSLDKSIESLSSSSLETSSSPISRRRCFSKFLIFRSSRRACCAPLMAAFCFIRSFFLSFSACLASLNSRFFRRASFLSFRWARSAGVSSPDSSVDYMVFEMLERRNNFVTHYFKVYLNNK